MARVTLEVSKSRDSHIQKLKGDLMSTAIEYLAGPYAVVYHAWHNPIHTLFLCGGVYFLGKDFLTWLENRFLS
ncbi:hypothetical protein Q669_30735 [Labrenzia sp. C1B10]|nr:hypothetical protein Q669_30735 [Labrenzia sp. C1B10]ERS02922.1 hypothetical protein Q675_31755 [Labrenzia sp. C1B70]